jgi:hypothetical protein
METLNPTWYQSEVLNVLLPSPLVFAPPLQVMVYDYDTVSKDDPMGRFSVPLTRIAEMNPNAQKLRPEWFPIFSWDNKPIAESKLLMTFQLLTTAQVQAIPVPIIKPPTIPMTIELTTLGLRHLNSTLGVHKTFIDFEVPGGKRFRTRPSKLPVPRNPNFCQVLKIPVDLPLDRIFAPTLNIEVRDLLFGGLIKRIIAANGLDLGQFMEQDLKDPEKWIITNKRINIVSDEEVEKSIEEDKENAFKAKMAEEIKRSAEAEERRRLADEAAAAKLLEPGVPPGGSDPVVSTLGKSTSLIHTINSSIIQCMPSITFCEPAFDPYHRCPSSSFGGCRLPVVWAHYTPY